MKLIIRMGFKIISLIFLAGGLFYDFKKDKGAFKKAKALHGLALTFLIYFYAGSFAFVGWIIRDFKRFKERYNVAVGLINADLNLYATALHILISILILFTAYNMINRKENARKNFLKVILLIIPTGTIAFYRSFQAEDPVEYDKTIFIMGLIITTVINLLLYYLYNTKMMEDFFKGHLAKESIKE